MMLATAGMLKYLRGRLKEKVNVSWFPCDMSVSIEKAEITDRALIGKVKSFLSAPEFSGSEAHGQTATPKNIHLNATHGTFESSSLKTYIYYSFLLLSLLQANQAFSIPTIWGHNTLTG